MLDQYRVDEVIEQYKPLDEREFHSQSTLSGVSPGGDTQELTGALVAAALGFHDGVDELYDHWHETVFTEVLDRHDRFLDPASTRPGQSDWSVLYAGVEMSVLTGSAQAEQLEELDKLLLNCPSGRGSALRCVTAFLQHEPLKAIAHYDEACAGGDTSESSRHVVAGLPVLAFALALIQQQSPEKVAESLNMLTDSYQTQHRGDLFIPVLRVLTDFARVAAGQRDIHQTVWLGGQHIDASPWLELFIGLCHHWLGAKPDKRLVSNMARHVDTATERGLYWYVDEGNALLTVFGKQRRECEFRPQVRSLGWLISVYHSEEDWSEHLEALARVVHRYARLTDADATDSDKRIAWWLKANAEQITIEPREQKRGKNKRWTKGRRVPLKTLIDDCGTLDYLGDHDLKICAALRRQAQSNHALYIESHFQLNGSELMSAVVGHPHLYRTDLVEESADPCRVVVDETQPRLQVIEDAALQRISIAMDPYPASSVKSTDDIACHWQGDSRLQLLRYTEGQLEIARLLTHTGLTVPMDAGEQVLKSLRSMVPLIEIHSDVGSDDGDAIAASDIPVFHLEPLETGLGISVFVYPFGVKGPYFQPAQGRQTLLAVIDNNSRSACRDLDAEHSRARNIVVQLPLSASDAAINAENNERWSWAISDPQQALEVLASLQELGDEVELLWPAGEKIELPPLVDCDSLQITISKKRGGISISGELKLEGGALDVAGGFSATDEVLDLKTLLEMMQDAGGRFLRLDDGNLIQLSRRLQMQLASLSAVCVDGIASPLAAPVLDEATRGMVLESDAAWQQQMEKLQEAESLVPDPPAALMAQLRDYQLEGFRWMARLAHWGAGACLADDMGLGKTMQTLALILLRCSEGPTLVVAPTSVCGNWIDEARRFAPSLRIRALGDGNRKRMLDSTRAGDLFVCSYGLLQNEIDRVNEIEWQTIVADEAQSFKNAGTRRSQAMMSLRGKFRIAASGTPIENNLGELWNLFRFINPGLLGSSKRFKERYAYPIEQCSDELAQDRLRRLIQPFILRRLKREVLTELPQRTEITHLVEFNEEESRFYEGLRHQAMERISEVTEVDSQQRFRVLAEISRLRQASCHPALVVDNPPCGSAKLRAFATIVEELRANGHRCLVFSQFTGHLALIREHLDSQSISYKYLDGSTSMKKRKLAVDEFQGGAGELFLISLKAGGSGLNLTAADYVIHMDPWWNPAVEDQASDRAYRMGQKRPVTIYRLVVKNTIEEKIVKLHEQKRELADGLLQGTDKGLRLSVENLVELINEESEETA